MTPERQPAGQPTPALLFDTLNGHQRTEAIKAAIELMTIDAKRLAEAMERLKGLKL